MEKFLLSIDKETLESIKVLASIENRSITKQIQDMLQIELVRRIEKGNHLKKIHKFAKAASDV